MGSINLYKIDNAKLPDFLRELGKYEERDARQQKVIIGDNSKTYEFQLYISEPQGKRTVPWNWVMAAFDEDDIEVVKSPSALLRIKAPSGNTYAVTFSHSFFLADKYADREFAFNFARRLEFDVIRATALTSPNSQRNRTVNSYIDYKDVEFDSGESFSKIKFNEKQPDGFLLYAPTLEIGNSIKFNVKDESLDMVAKLIEYVEDTIRTKQERNKIPVFSKIRDKDKIDRLNTKLRKAVAICSAEIVIPEFDIIGANEVFNRTDCEFDLLYSEGNNHYHTHTTNLSDTELHSFCDENKLVYATVVLDIVVARYKDGKIVVRKKVQDLIEYTDDQERSVLANGIWYDFNDDYLTYLRDSIAEIKAEYHPEYDFTTQAYQDFLDEKYKVEAPSYKGKEEKDIREALRKKYYAERVFNLLREANDGFENHDRGIDSVDGQKIELMDLYSDGKMFAVKMGNTSAKLCYVIDQSLTALKAYRNHSIAFSSEINTVVLWIVLDTATHIEDENGKPDLNRLKMLMLKNRLDQWKKEVRVQGYKPLIYINYDQR